MGTGVAVIGSGLQGCGVALELALRGQTVDLYERAPRLLQDASRHSEGKLHLGYVYAADDTMQTARLMASGAAAFLPTVERWLGPNAKGLVFSARFNYGVHRRSMLPVDELASRYESISRIVRTAFRDHPSRAASEAAQLRRLEAGDRLQYSDLIEDAYETGEIAVDTDTLSDAVERAVLGRPQIRAYCSTSVNRVDMQERRLALTDENSSARISDVYDHIVNCSWGSLPGIDATAGVFSRRPWSHRIKYFVRRPATDTVATLPSTTFVLGQFGDVVDFGRNGAYLSWYPAGRTTFTTGLQSPAGLSEPDEQQARSIRYGVLCGLSTVMPAVSALPRQAVLRSAVRGGEILAHGQSDLDDESTELHQRHTIGPSSSAGYHSVNTGKLTMAPYFAMQVAERIRPTT